MPLRDFRLTNQTGAWDYQAVADHLAARGYQIGPGGIGTAIDPDDPTTVVVRVDLDPHVPDATIAADLDAFAPDLDPVATAQVDLRKAVATLRTGGEALPIDEWRAAIQSVVLAYATTLGV